MPLNANHRRALASGFGTIDKQLREIEAKLSSPAPSPFAPYAVDLDDRERSTVLDYVSRARGQMLDALRAVGIGISRARGSARSSIQTVLTFALINVDELAPSRLRGYGALDDDSSAAVDRVMADLRRTLRQLQNFVSRDPAADVAARLARIDAAPIDVDELRQIDAIAARRGFLELRGAIMALTEQLETRTYEVAVFGRVSSGKSSLLDAVLGMRIVPVGVTPVTAVPTRIVHGAVASATVRFEDGREQEIEIEQLIEFVTEQQNPGNQKRVFRVTARVPSERLAAGIALVDTPGVGSLARTGARATYAYLPRCDLGVVLIDASGAIAAEDVEIVRLLTASGVRANVMLSKADLVAEHDRAAIEAYVRREVHAATGLSIAPAWVSSTAADGALARAWFDQRVAPLLADARHSAEMSIRAKLAQLHAETVAALRSLGTDHTPSPESAERTVHLDALASEAQRQLDAAESRGEDIVSSVSVLLADVVRAAARAIVDRRSSVASDPEAIDRAAREAVAPARTRVTDEITHVAERLTALLRRMIALDDAPVGELRPFLVDFLSLPSLRVPDEVRRVSTRATWLPEGVQLRRVQHKLADDAGAAMARALHDFSRELRAWVRSSIASLGEQFAAAADPLRARARRGGGGSTSDATIEDDLSLLGVGPQ